MPDIEVSVLDQLAKAKETHIQPVFQELESKLPVLNKTEDNSQKCANNIDSIKTTERTRSSTSPGNADLTDTMKNQKES